MLATGCSGDTSGVGAFSRLAVDTDKYEATGQLADNGQFSVESWRALGESAEIAVSPGDLLPVNDAFDYAPTPGQQYQAVIAYDADNETFNFTYLHQVESDSPIASFPDDRTEAGLTPDQLLDCLRAELEATGSRFDALIVTVETDTQAIWRCGLG